MDWFSPKLLFSDLPDAMLSPDSRARSVATSGRWAIRLSQGTAATLLGLAAGRGGSVKTRTTTEFGW